MITGTCRPDIGLANWFRLRAERTPTRRAVTFACETLTYADVQQRIEATAAGFAAMGIRRGDRVAYLGLNHPDFLISLFATSRLGAIFVPLNHRLAAAEIAHMIADAACALIVADARHAPVVDEVRADLDPALQCASTEERPGWFRLRGQGVAPAGQVKVDDDDCALILYTSGTTGTAKGVMLSHGSLWWNNVNSLHDYDVRSDDRTLVSAPLFHIGGLNVITLVALQKGAEIILHAGFDPDEVFDAIPAHRVTTMFGVPSMYQVLARHERFPAADLSTLRVLMCGGAPLPLPLLKMWEARGIAIHQGYGMTEAAPLVTYLPARYAVSKSGSAGIPPLYTDVRIVDGAGDPVTGPRQTGEVQVRGPNMFTGYWRRDADTRAATVDGWFRSGDSGWVDEDGFLFISDRIKDIVISGGENIAPAEIEGLLLTHPDICDAAVIGIPDERWGETPLAILVPRAGAAELTLEGIRAFLESRLARYKLPRAVRTVAAIPRNAAGKVLKYQLRREYGGEGA